MGVSWLRREGGGLGYKEVEGEVEDGDGDWCSGQMRMCPGRRGLRFTRAKVWGVVWKTCHLRVRFGSL